MSRPSERRVFFAKNLFWLSAEEQNGVGRAGRMVAFAPEHFALAGHLEENRKFRMKLFPEAGDLPRPERPLTARLPDLTASPLRKDFSGIAAGAKA